MRRARTPPARSKLSETPRKSPGKIKARTDLLRISRRSPRLSFIADASELGESAINEFARRKRGIARASSALYSRKAVERRRGLCFISIYRLRPLVSGSRRAAGGARTPECPADAPIVADGPTNGQNLAAGVGILGRRVVIYGTIKLA